MSDYTLIKRLNSGSYAEALLVRMKKSRQISVVKVPLSSSPLGDDVIKESILLKSMKHPNIIKLKNLLTHESRIVMELERMDNHLKLQKLNLVQFRATLKDIVSGVRRVHLEGFGHHDLKPANILVRSGKVKVADFGLCQFKSIPRSSLGYCTGTPIYTAPQCIDETSYIFRNKDIVKGQQSILADVWGIGVFIYDFVHHKVYGKSVFDTEEIMYLLDYNVSAEVEQYRNAKDKGLPSGWRTIEDTEGNIRYKYELRDITEFADDSPLKKQTIIEHVGETGFDLMRQCLTLETHLRPTTTDILKHPFFKESDIIPFNFQQQPQQFQQLQQQGGTPQDIDIDDLYHGVWGKLLPGPLKSYQFGYLSEWRELWGNRIIDSNKNIQSIINNKLLIIIDWLLTSKIRLSPDSVIFAGRLIRMYISKSKEPHKIPIQGYSMAALRIGTILYKQSPLERCELIYASSRACNINELTEFESNLLLALNEVESINLSHIGFLLMDNYIRVQTPANKKEMKIILYKSLLIACYCSFLGLEKGSARDYCYSLMKIANTGVSQKEINDQMDAKLVGNSKINLDHIAYIFDNKKFKEHMEKIDKMLS